MMNPREALKALRGSQDTQDVSIEKMSQNTQNSQMVEEQPLQIGDPVRYAGVDYKIIEIEIPPWSHFVAMEIIRPKPEWKNGKGEVKRVWRWVEQEGLERL